MTKPTHYAFAALGSDCAFHLYDRDCAAAAAAEAEIHRIERRYSRYCPDSLLSQINRCAAAGGSIDVYDEAAALLDYAFACHRKSGGLFDITTGALRRVWNFSGGRLPDAAAIAACLPLVGLDQLCWERPILSFRRSGLEIDFGGIAKEYAADRAAAVCQEAGISSGLIDLGGDIRVIGPHPDGTPWSVCLRDPAKPGCALGTVPLFSGALATSGDYARCLTNEGRRYGHILDPKTGWPTAGIASVSVTAATCLLAGTAATIAMLKGIAGPDWLGNLGVDYIWVDVNGHPGSSAGFRQRIGMTTGNWAA